MHAFFLHEATYGYGETDDKSLFGSLEGIFSAHSREENWDKDETILLTSALEHGHVASVVQIAITTMDHKLVKA